MIKGPLLLTLSLFFSHLISCAQEEKIYVQTDRETYKEGETMHFKAFIFSSDSLPANHLFVEIWDSKLNKLNETTIPVIDATASGSISIPKDVLATQIFFRAFTDHKPAGFPQFQFVKPILDLPAKKAGPASPIFFPEGGKLVQKAMNYVAFRSNPFYTASIRNSRGDKIVNIQADENGYGVFKLRPVKGESYICHGKTNGNDSIFSLPSSVDNFFAIHLYQLRDTLFFDMDNGGSPATSLQHPRVQLMIGNEISYVVDLKMNGLSSFTYHIPLKNFPEGPAKLVLLDAANQLLAERWMYLPGKNMRKPSLEIVQKDLDKRGTNIFQLNLADTTITNVSISVTDADKDTGVVNTGLRSVLFPVEIPRKIIEDAKRLDLFMMTSKINEELSFNKGDTVSKKPADFLQLKGTVKKGKKIFANKEVLLMIRSEYTGREYYKVVTNDKGEFLINDLILYGEAFVQCQVPGNSAEELSCDLQMFQTAKENDPFLIKDFQNKIKEWESRYTRPATKVINTAIDPSLLQDTIVFGQKAIVLQEAIVKTNSRQLAQKRLEELENKYLAGTGFAGYSTNAETIDVLNDPVAHKSTSIFTYIAARFHMIKMNYIWGRPELIYPIRGTHGDTLIRSYYLNGTKITRDLLDGVTMENVALIKFFPMLGMEFGMPPAVAIFLKKPNDKGYWENEKVNAVQYKITGYPVSKELPTPDYSNNEIKVESDTRKTLLWQPYTVVTKGVAAFRFYNNDISKRIRIKAEAIASNGNIIYFDQIVE